MAVAPVVTTMVMHVTAAGINSGCDDDGCGNLSWKGSREGVGGSNVPVVVV